MNDWLLYGGLIALILIFVLTMLSIVSDVRSGVNRFAHSEADVRREQLPLNFWLGVASKGSGAATALLIAILLVTRLD